MPLRSFFYLTIILLVGLLAFLGFRTIRDSGLLFKVEPTFTGTCQAITGISGGEDITIDRHSGIAYISADNRWAALAGTPLQGKIFALQADDQTVQPVDLTPGLPFSFHPHGISLYHAADGEIRLFVINHREDGTEQVEIFRVNGLQPLQHLESITYPALISPNDLVATGKQSFYSTSDHGFPRHHLMQTVENYLGLPLAKVTYYDGSQGKVVADGLRYANGITISPDGNTLYVAEVIARRMRVFSIGEQPDIVTETRVVPVGTGLDNLEWGDDGYLWTGAHPKLFDFVAHVSDPEALSPSHVVRINPADFSVSTVYLNDGRELSGSSVATIAGKTLLIGPVFEHHLLRCQMP